MASVAVAVVAVAVVAVAVVAVAVAAVADWAAAGIRLATLLRRRRFRALKGWRMFGR